MKHIQSRENPLFKQLRKLATSSRARRDEKDNADRRHSPVSKLPRRRPSAAPDAARTTCRRSDGNRRLIGRQAGETIVLGDALFDELSPSDTPTGLLAMIDIPETPMTSPTGDCLVLDAVQDSGNLGTLLRAAWATGAPDVLLTAGCAQAWSPKVLRAGQGAHFGLRIREQCDLADALRGYPGKIVATRLDATQSLFALDLRGPVAWLFGNEGAGLSPSASSLATDAVRIPMPGAAESLNVAMAATVCLFEQVRQRQSD
jgi:TrmH family RNA methyltransferase